MGNRRKGDVWKYFRKVSQNAQGKAKVSCTFCGCTYLENATRMNTHLQKCSGYRKIHSIFTPDGEQPGPSSYMAEQEALNYASSFQNGMIRHPYVEHMPHHQTQENEIRELLARAIFASGFPMGLVDDPYWRAFFKALSPGFVPPSPNQLQAGYLETEYCNLKDKIDKKIYECQCVGIIIESLRNEGYVNVFVSTPKCYFYKNFPKPSTENLKDDSLSLIENLLQNLGNEKIVSLVADKSSGLLDSARFIEEKHAHIAVYQCLHEAVEILLKNIILFPEHVNNVWKRFEELKIMLRESSNEIAHISSPVIQYIYSHRNYDFSILSYLLNSKSVVTDFLFGKENKSDPEGCVQFTTDKEFWLHLEKLIQLVEPIANVLSDFETKAPPPLSHVVHLYRRFYAHLENRLSDPYYSHSDKSHILGICQEFKEALLHPIHLAADLLDPQSKGTSLSRNEQMMATEYIYKLAVFSKDVNDEDLLADLANYKACDDLWGKEYIWKAVHKLHPVSWWNGFCSNTNLSKIAVRIFNLPSTTRYEKSIFNSYENVTEHCTANSINFPKVKEMLIFVSRNFKFMKKEIAETALECSSPFQRLPARNVSQNSESLHCIPKLEKDQPHYDAEPYEGYKYL